MCTPSFACPVSGNGEALYNKFYSSVYFEDGTDEEGNTIIKSRGIDDKTATAALSCLKQSAALGNCSANYMLSMFYKHGNFGTGLPIRKDSELAKEYERKSKQLCRKSGA